MTSEQRKAGRDLMNSTSLTRGIAVTVLGWMDSPTEEEAAKITEFLRGMAETCGWTVDRLMSEMRTLVA
jgi:hypothetical protein